MKPLVSIIIPSYNAGAFIASTLDSVLAQSHRPLEIIVADGASKDNTVEVLRDYAARHPEIRWQSEPDKGPADAVNKGLALMNGEIAAIQSADDLYYPEAIADVVKLMQANPDCGLVCGDVDGIDRDGKVLYRRKMPDFSWESYFGISLCLPQSSMFFRTDLAREVGGWNSSYYGCDLDFWLRMIFRTRVMKIDRALSAWRRYDDQRTRPDQFRRIWLDYSRMIDDSEDIRRAPPRVRRLAQASKHLMALRFPPTDSLWQTRLEVLRGFLLHPGFWRYNAWQMNVMLLPGYTPLKRAYHGIRRLLDGGRAAG